MFFNKISNTNIETNINRSKIRKLPNKSKAHELLSALYYQLKRTKRRAQPLCKIHLKLANKNFYKVRLKL